MSIETPVPPPRYAQTPSYRAQAKSVVMHALNRSLDSFDDVWGEINDLEKSGSTGLSGAEARSKKWMQKVVHLVRPGATVSGVCGESHVRYCPFHGDKKIEALMKSAAHSMDVAVDSDPGVQFIDVTATVRAPDNSPYAVGKMMLTQWRGYKPLRSITMLAALESVAVRPDKGRRAPYKPRPHIHGVLALNKGMHSRDAKKLVEKALGGLNGLHVHVGLLDEKGATTFAKYAVKSMSGRKTWRSRDAWMGVETAINVIARNTQGEEIDDNVVSSAWELVFWWLDSTDHFPSPIVKARRKRPVSTVHRDYAKKLLETNPMITDDYAPIPVVGCRGGKNGRSQVVVEPVPYKPEGPVFGLEGFRAFEETLSTREPDKGAQRTTGRFIRGALILPPIRKRSGGRSVDWGRRWSRGCVGLTEAVKNAALDRLETWRQNKCGRKSARVKREADVESFQGALRQR